MVDTNDIMTKIDAVLKEAGVEYSDNIDDFKKWYYIYEINENKDDDADEFPDATEEEVTEAMEDYQVSELDEFVEEFLDNSDFSDPARRYFHVANFVEDLIECDGYCIFRYALLSTFPKKFKGFLEINRIDEKTIWMDEGGCCTLDTYYIIKKN